MRCDGAMGSFPILLHQDYLQRPPVRCFKIVGDAGYAEIDLLANRLRVYGAEGELSEENDFPGFVRNDMFLALSLIHIWAIPIFPACVSN